MRAEYIMRATKGTAPQTMLATMMLYAPISLPNQLWLLKFKPSELRAVVGHAVLLLEQPGPNVAAAEVGMAQANSMHTVTTVRSTLPMRPRSSATPVPTAIVRPTHGNHENAVCRIEVPKPPPLAKSVR